MIFMTLRGNVNQIILTGFCRWDELRNNFTRKTFSTLLGSSVCGSNNDETSGHFGRAQLSPNFHAQRMGHLVLLFTSDFCRDIK